MRFKPRHPLLRWHLCLALAGSLAAAAPSAMAFPFTTVEDTQNSEDVSELNNIPPFGFGLGFADAFDPVYLAFIFGGNVIASFLDAGGFPTFDVNDVEQIRLQGSVESRAFDYIAGSPSSATERPADAAEYILDFTYTSGVQYDSATDSFVVLSQGAANPSLGAGTLDFQGKTSAAFNMTPSGAGPGQGDDLGYTPGFNENECDGVGGTEACLINLAVTPTIPVGGIALQVFPSEGDGFDGAEGASQGIVLGGLISGDCDPANPINTDGQTDFCGNPYNQDPVLLLNNNPARAGNVGFVSSVAPPQAAPVNSGGIQSGSAVLYPLFQLESQGNNNHTTVIRLTNNHPNDDVTVHLVYVCGGEKDPDAARRCDAGNREVTLTHNQTKNWNVENFFNIGSACITRSGFVLAYAVDPLQASVPIEWNWLSGSTYQRRPPSAFKPNSTAGAQAVVFEGDPGKIVAPGAALPGAVGGAFPLLPFDGFAYQQLGTTLNSDFIATTNAANPVNGRRSAIALLTLDIQAGFQNEPTVVALDWWNQAEVLFSTSHEYICHTYRELQDISAGFELGNLGSYYGNIKVTPFGADAIQGQMKELEPNRETLRNFFHDADTRSTIFQSR